MGEILAPKRLIPKADHTLGTLATTLVHHQTYTNSVRAFSALLESMLKKEVVGVGVLIARANSSPQMVYMLPQVSTVSLATSLGLNPTGAEVPSSAFSPTNSHSLNISRLKCEMKNRTCKTSHHVYGSSRCPLRTTCETLR